MDILILLEMYESCSALYYLQHFSSCSVYHFKL